jgi:flagellar biogenesis protein FliO
VSVLLQQAPSAIDGGSYLAELVRMLLALGVVSVLAFFVLRWLGKRGLGGAAYGPSDSLRVLRKLPLDARSSLYVVRAGPRVLLVATGEGASPRLLSELDPAAFDAPAPAKEPSGSSA